MGRLLGIDYGRKRCGVAVTDPLRIVASALTTVPTHTIMEFITGYLGKEKVDGIVVGEPRQLNGQPSESMRYIAPFVAKLRKSFPEVNIELFDE